MPKEIKVMCPLGNGECPPTCKNYEAAKKLSEAMGNNFNPELSRLSLVFGDISHDINVIDVANAIAKCIKEKKPSEIKLQ